MSASGRMAAVALAGAVTIAASFLPPTSEPVRAEPADPKKVVRLNIPPTKLSFPIGEPLSIGEAIRTSKKNNSVVLIADEKFLNTILGGMAGVIKQNYPSYNVEIFRPDKSRDIFAPGTMKVIWRGLEVPTPINEHNRGKFLLFLPQLENMRNQQ